MGSIPSSLVTAVACSAAAGKNPWLPLAMIFLLAAPDAVPGFVMDPDLHRQLHGLMPVEALWSLGAVFAVLAAADSFGDKIGVVEKWLVPVSTAWRPFAGVACASIIGVAAAQDVAAPEAAEALRAALTETADASLLVGGGIVALTVVVSALFNWIATVGKTGIRLLLTMVPVPGLKLAHSLVDDFFALGATVAGLVFADSAFVVVLLALYLFVGLFTAPVLTRLALIHVRIGWGLFRKAVKAIDEEALAHPTPPRWVLDWLAARGLSEATVLPAYVYRAPELGLCRGGHLVVAEGTVAFVARVLWRPRAWVVEESSLARLGLAETTTSRVVTPVERLASGALRAVDVYLYPAVAQEVFPSLERGARRAGLVQVKSDSESARAALPGYADRDRSVRFAPAEEGGDLRLQGVLTIAAAVTLGVLTGGVFIPVGLGYFASPYKRRGLVGLLVSGYLAAAVFFSFGLGWPAAVLYASVLNAVALRDLTRNALKVRVDGFVDRRAWLPLTAGHVWVPRDALVSASDRWTEGAPEPVADGSWRAVVRLLGAESSPAS